MHTLTLLRIPSRYLPDYKEVYLLSDRWKRKRAKVITRDGACRLCGVSDVRFDVHHLSYRYIGREPLRHLATLCRDCHKLVTAVERPGYARVVFEERK